MPNMLSPKSLKEDSDPEFYRPFYSAALLMILERSLQKRAIPVEPDLQPSS